MTQLNKQMLNKKKGFTLTELAIVIAVIAILVAVLVPTFTSILSKARESAALQNSKNAVTTYAIDDENVVVPENAVVYDGSGDAIYAYVSGELKPIDVIGTNSSSASTLTGGTTYHYALDSETYYFIALDIDACYYGTAYIWEADKTDGTSAFAALAEEAYADYNGAGTITEVVITINSSATVYTVSNGVLSSTTSSSASGVAVSDWTNAGNYANSTSGVSITLNKASE